VDDVFKEVGNSNVASPKIWEGPKMGGSKMLVFRQITLFFRIPPLKTQNDYMFRKLGGMAPNSPHGYACGRETLL